MELGGEVRAEFGWKSCSHRTLCSVDRDPNAEMTIVITIEESATHFLIFIPADQRERAKRIPGRSWDARRRCWVIPKNDLAYDAIVMEFGDEMPTTATTITAPEATPRNSTPSASDAFTVDAVEVAVPKEPVVGEPGTDRTAARDDDKTVLAILDRLAEKDLQLAMAQQEVASLRNRLEENARAIAPTAVPSSISEALVVLLGELFPGDKPAVLAKAVEGDADLAISLARKLETDLRVALRQTREATFFDLIEASGHRGWLSEQGMDAAHFLRKARIARSMASARAPHPVRY